MGEQLYDVVAVNIETSEVRLIASKETRGDADAVVKMAVMRRGVDKEFYSEVAHGRYKEGDKWESKGDVPAYQPDPVRSSEEFDGYTGDDDCGWRAGADSEPLPCVHCQKVVHGKTTDGVPTCSRCYHNTPPYPCRGPHHLSLSAEALAAAPALAISER